MKFVSLVVIYFSIRLTFFFFYFQNDVNVHMLQRFDERALAVLNGIPKSDFAAWGIYPLFLGIFYKIIHFFNLIELRFEIIFWFNQVLSLFSLGILYRLIKGDNQSSRKLDALFLLLFILNPYFIYLTGMNMSESLFFLGIVLSFYCLRQAEAGDSLQYSLFSGILLAFAVGLRSISSLFVVAVLIYLVWLSFRFKRSYRPVLVMISGFVAVTLVLSYWSSIFDTNKHFGTSLNRGPNIAQTWCEAQTIQTEHSKGKFWFRPPEYMKGAVTEGIYIDRPFSETSFFVQMALNCLLDNPTIVILRLRSIINSFDGILYPDPASLSATKLLDTLRWIFLVLLAFVLYSIPSLLKSKETRIFLIYVLSCFGSVYIGNIGELRFLYSILPGLVGLLYYSVKSEDKILLSSKSVASVVTAVLFLSIPSVSELQRIRNHYVFTKMNREQILSLISERRQFLRGSEEVCKSEMSFMEKLDEGVNKNQETQSYLKTHFKAPLDEFQFFCRNFLLVSLRNQKRIDVSLSMIGLVEPLPGGLSISQPLVAVAGQMLYYDLLIGTGQFGVPSKEEGYFQLLELFFKYQHRTQFNRPDMQGKVVEYLYSKDIDPHSEAIFKLSFDLLPQSINFHANRGIPFDRLKSL